MHILWWHILHSVHEMSVRGEHIESYAILPTNMQLSTLKLESCEVSYVFSLATFNVVPDNNIRHCQCAEDYLVVASSGENVDK